MIRPTLALLLAFGLAAGATQLLRPPERYVEGVARVIDGDSLVIAGVPIRLKGIDAPELRQTCRRDSRPYPCGETARTALAEAIAGRPVFCRVAGRDRYARALAHCSVAGEDLGALLIGRGLAVGYGSYEREERLARQRSLGLWSAEFELPSDWRRANPRS
jgi:endonuclease YncB( thermonuclease family)